jgi:hypothetical protein
MNPFGDLGPCAVIFGDGGGEDLGSTMGGVIFRHTEESTPVKEDQSGVSAIDEIKVGYSCEVEVPLTRSSLGQLSKVIGNSTYTGKALRVGVAVGISLLENAKQLILKPIVNNIVSTDPTEWLTIHKAYPKVDLEVVYNSEGQRVYKCIFKVFPDENKQLWRIG